MMLLICQLLGGALGCGDQKSPTSATSTSQQKSATNGSTRDCNNVPFIDSESESDSPSLSVKLYADAKGALADILLRTNPAVIGFGEFHQQQRTVKIRSALERFRTDLLPLLGQSSSDLIIETWVPKGCGKVEKKAIEEVAQVTDRPSETENETVRLINSSKQLGVVPHILDVKCEQYESLFDTEGQMDFLAMLELVGKLLGDTGENALAYRKKNPVGARQRLLIYAGAIHNDLYFAEQWKTCTFGPRFKSRTEKYIAVDLYVPEFIENNNLVKTESWYALFKEYASPTMAVLIEKAPDSYILVFKRGVLGGAPH